MFHSQYLLYRVFNHIFPRLVVHLSNDRKPHDTLSADLSVHETSAERLTHRHHLPVWTWEEFVEGCSSSAGGANRASQSPMRLTNVPNFQASMWTPMQHLVRASAYHPLRVVLL